MPTQHRYEQEFDAIAVQLFTGRLPEAVRIDFEAWLQQDIARRDQLERLRAIWEVSADPPAELDVDTAFAHVRQRIDQRQRVATAARPALKLEPAAATTRRPWPIMAWRVAAAVALVAGAGVLWRAAAGPQSHIEERAARTYTTARGERATVTLPDGSTVMLHNQSTLKIPVDFGRLNRDVWLKGEGYFEVAHDPSRPFRVYGRTAVAQVLGTRFGVRARPEDAAARVAVAEGRVAVGTGRVTAEAPVLTAGQVATVSERGVAGIQRNVDVDRLLSWTAGRLVFDGTPVPEVLAELSRWFDRDFALGDASVAALKLTTSISGQSLAEAVQVLEVALEVRATMAGHRIVLARP